MDFLKELADYVPYDEQEQADKALITQCISHFPDILTRTNQVAHLTGSSLIFNKTRDKVLMAYHNIYDVWAWTGGHADGEQDMLLVAMKEAKEETGITEVTPITTDLMALDVLSVASHYKKGAFVSAHLHLSLAYALEADDTAPLTIKEDENSRVGWLTIAEALGYAREKEPRIAQVYEKIIMRTMALEKRR